MKLWEDRYIQENFSAYEDGIYLIEAGQGSGKTERLKDLHDKKVLLIGARNRLGQSTVDRLGFIESTHIKDEELGLTYNAEELQQFQNIFINIASLQKFTWPPETDQHKPEYFVIDEALLVWLFILDDKDIVPYSAYQEFLARIIHTPKVILMGATFPYFLRKKLKELAQYRKDRNYQHIKYQNPFLEGTEIQYVSSCKELDNEIKEVMDIRLEGRGNRFLLRDQHSTDPGHLYSPAYLEGKRYPKGVLIVSERGKSVETVKRKWQEHYPDAQIVCIWSANSKEYDHLLENLGDPATASEIDMIITSPSWGTGINIRNFADLTVGDYGLTPKALHTDEDILQGMTRDRDSKRWVIWPRRIDQDKIKKAFVGDLNSIANLEKHFEFHGIKKDNFYERNPITNESQPRDIEYMRDKIRISVWKHNHKINRWPLLEKKTEKLGATSEKTYSKAIEKNLPKNHFIDKWKDEAFLCKAAAGSEKPIDEWTDKDKWIHENKHKLRDRQRARKELEIKAWLKVDRTLTGAEERFFVHKLIEETRELFMTLTNEENIVWLEIFKESRQWQMIFSNRNRINKLLDSKGWHFKVKNEVELDPLHFLKKVLEEFNYYALIKAGLSQTRKGHQAKTKKDNLKAFNKWKKLQTRTHLRIQDYLFESLAEGKIDPNDLSITTRKYLLGFSHIVIEESSNV